MPITTYSAGVPTVPKARIMFAPDDGTPDFETPRCYLGLADPFTANVQANSEQVFSAECGVDELIDDIETQILRTATLAIRNLSDQAQAFFWVGDIVTMTKVAAVGVTESLRLEPGKYYQLGVDAAFPSGTRRVSNLVVTGLTEDTDFEFDPVMARLYVKTVAEGFTGTPGAVVLHTYDQDAATWQQVRSGRSTVYQGPILVQACNFVRGTPRDIFLPRVQLRPNGDFTLKQLGSTPVSAPFSLSILTPTDGRAAVYVDGMPA